MGWKDAGIIFAVLLLAVGFRTLAQDSSEIAREDEQLSLAEALNDDQKAIDDVKIGFKLNQGLDFEALLKDGNLSARVRAIAPPEDRQQA